jgi:hypothetical protein
MCVRFEAVMAVTGNSAVYWVLVTYSLVEVFQCFLEESADSLFRVEK